MPTYDYVCAACGHALEIFQAMSEAPKKKCPKCGKSKLERRIGAGAGFLFKGSGFYLTDYRSKGYTAQSEAERKLATSSESSTDKSSTDKPAATPTAETKPVAKTDAPPRVESPSKSAAKRSTPTSSAKKKKS